MKNALKFGFGFAFGTWLFGFTKKIVDGCVDRYFEKHFEEDVEFRIRVKKISPELYAKMRSKMNQE